MQPVDHLIAAVINGDTARVEQLLANDVGLASAANMFGATPVHAAHFTGQAELTRRLLEPRDPADVQLAAELGDLEALHRLVTASAVAAMTFSATGASPLHGACYWGQVSSVQMLIDAGADVNLPTRDTFLQITPLGSAVANTPGIPQPSDEEEVVLVLVRLLLEAGAAPNARRKDGMTSLHAAAWRGLDRVVQELLDAGADPSCRATAGPHEGETAADSALSQGHLVLAARLDAGDTDVAHPYA